MRGDAVPAAHSSVSLSSCIVVPVVVVDVAVAVAVAAAALVHAPVCSLGVLRCGGALCGSLIAFRWALHWVRP